MARDRRSYGPTGRPGWRLILAATMVTLWGCTPSLPSAPQDDAGDESFVRQVVPVLLGRKVRGHDELKALTDLIQATDRATVARALMEQDEFVDYWSEEIVDHLQLHREGSKSQTACYGPGLLAGAPTAALADFVLGNPPSAQFPNNFNMSDLVRSAIVRDNLFAIYRGHLFALASRPDFFLVVEKQMREDLGASFEHVYLNRQSGCLLCHNSEFSTSGEASGWDRTHPVPGEFEAAIYGASTGTSPEQAFAIFRTDVRNGSLRPWGQAPACGTFKPSVVTDPENVTAWFTAPLGRQVSVRNLGEILRFGYLGLESGGLDRSLSVTVQEQCEFCATSCEGVGVDPDAPLNAVNAAAVKTILLDNCATASCHAEGSAGGNDLRIYPGNDWFTELVNAPATLDGEIRAIPAHAADSYLIKKLENAPGIAGSQMPLGNPALSDPEIETIANWINDIPEGAACNACDTLDCNPAYPPRVEGHEATAFLLAERIVDNVWRQVFGYPLTIANYFPRNSSQRDALWNLSEYSFVPNEWSLKELLIRLVTSNFFNRKAPTSSAASTPYRLPMLFDPWVEADPREPPVSEPGYDPAANPQVHNNAMSDGIHRYTAHNLLRSVHRALGWPAPQRFPPAAGYPDQALERAIGQFFTDSEAGFQTVDFQGLLQWENVHGVCDRTGIVPADWIDSVLAEVASFPDGGDPLSVEDLVVLFRDWLLGDGHIGTVAPVDVGATEQAALAGYFGVASLDTSASAVADLATKLRGLCGVLIETPQFWLAGLAPEGPGPEPRLRVCTAGPCSYQEVCESLEPAIESSISGTLTCAEDSVSVTTGRMGMDLICPPEICGRLPMPERRLRACLANPLDCPRDPPACDPRCSRIDCCGGPLPPLDRRGYLVAWADGAAVERAKGVRILRPGAHRFVALESGMSLREGDLLAISPGSELRVRTAQGEIATPKGGLSKDDPAGPRLVMITGARVLSVRQPRPVDRAPKIDRKAIDRRYQKAWWQWGEAGRPLTAEQRRGFVGPEEKLFRERHGMEGKTAAQDQTNR